MGWGKKNSEIAIVLEPAAQFASGNFSTKGLMTGSLIILKAGIKQRHTSDRGAGNSWGVVEGWLFNIHQQAGM